jgi:hypothetical protein
MLALPSFSPSCLSRHTLPRTAVNFNPGDHRLPFFSASLALDPLDGVPEQLAAGLELQFLFDVLTVCIDRFYTHMKRVCDLPCAIALANQAKHL